MLTLKDRDRDRLPGTKDTDFLPKEITARYNTNTAALAVP
jgi:hypothetical protein